MIGTEDSSESRIARWAAAVASACASARWLTVFVVLALTVASAWYAVTTLRINTDNLDMISADAPFRKANLEFREAFPWFGDQMAVVIDAPAPEMAEQEAARLAAAMRARADLFEHVQAPGIDPFLRRHGLLFMETEKLQDLLDRLAADDRIPLDRPALGDLLADPSGFIGTADAQVRAFADAVARWTAAHPAAAAYRPGAIL